MDKKLIWLLCLIYVINFTSTEYENKDNVQFDEEDTKLKYIRVKSNGQVTYKEIAIHHIMGSVQMGIKETMEYYIDSGPGCDVLIPDFIAVDAVKFPQKGTEYTPPHSFPEFTFKTYAPVIFNNFRNLYGIDHSQYKASFCSLPLVELSNPGASGSLLYITPDKNFIMKTVSRKESQFLRAILTGYYINFTQNIKTLLPKFFGLYRYQSNLINVSEKTTNGEIKNIRLVTMNNLLPSNIKIHEKYDLKGSTYNRRASENEKKKNLPTFKDLDFLDKHKDGFYLEPQTYLELIDILYRDCRVLRSFEIMDFSLLMAVHYVDDLENENDNQQSQSPPNSEEEEDILPIRSIRALNKQGDKLLLFIGIIDILQSYGVVKMLEHNYKAITQKADEVSVQKPDFYARRFLKFMTQNVFKKIIYAPNNSPLESKYASLDHEIDDPEWSEDDEEETISPGEDNLEEEKDNLQPIKAMVDLGHRLVGDNKSTNYKKISTNQILSSIQLGFKHGIKHFVSDPEQDLLMSDFVTVKALIFPPGGSRMTPSHDYPDFTFKSYAPKIFNHFRSFYDIEIDDYQQSFYSSSLHEVSNPGASGSIFFVTGDDKYIMKTVQQNESRFLENILPGYYINFDQNPNTFLPKFFGLYRYQCNSNYLWMRSEKKKTNIRLLVMNNLLPSNIKIHEKYDLKGSTLNRKASEKEMEKSLPTMKDLDFNQRHPNGIFLESNDYSTLIDTLYRDCNVLKSFKIMDYSLLIGIHYVNREQNTMEKPIVQKLLKNDDGGLSIRGIPATNEFGDQLVLFIGIIDVLQNYGVMKQLEHAYKSIIYDGNTVSVNSPKFYADRFLEFMAKSVFKEIYNPLKRSSSLIENRVCKFRASDEHKWLQQNDLPWK